MARAGSCKIGFKPSPSFGMGEIMLKGLELNNKNNKKPIIKIF